ncbi:GNAT family N-acetyltransferase [Nocardioides sp. GXQ0305]|uniref:GNAT family N-acetyltransferase n=1 Tax=Nocardioides sp. GXQ0305 TaxID=3423912 RepID=UPI003D7E84B9
MRLEPFPAAQAALVSGWAPTPGEVRSWCARSEAPVPPEVVASWGEADDVEAFLLVDDHGVPLGYGELWLDDDEGEVELARLLVDPARRGEGVGRRLTRLLAEQARDAHPDLPTVCLRVLPDNVAGHRAYEAAGLAFVDPDTEAAWNAGQPTAYRWMVLR